jgi:peptidoglycan/LPS O-acetylase OafA/YrhL
MRLELEAAVLPARSGRSRSGEGAYRPDIDGLRAVAVLAVVLYHAFPSVLTGGFVGVDVFFVISGFLISGIILRELDAGQFSVRHFYARRARRIFPALILVLSACLAYGFVVLLPTELALLGKGVASGAGFIANLVLWQEVGYFDREATAKPLLHLWSLAVEEQFYMVWPLAMWATRRAGTRQIAWLVLITVASFCLNLALAGADAAADFYSPATRLWELSAGAVLAWVALHSARGWPRPLDGRFRDAGSCAGLVLILAAASLLRRDMDFPGVLALVPVAGALLMIAAGPGALPNRLVLSNRGAVLIGLISYPLYLWHWPLISLAYIIGRGHGPKPLPAAGIVGGSMVLAWLTCTMIELPVRTSRRLFPTALPLTAGLAVVGALGWITWERAGFPSRYPGMPQIDIANINAAIGDGVFQPTSSMRVKETDRISVAEIGNGPRTVVFVGDSVIYHFGPRVEALLDRGSLSSSVLFVVGASCAPMRGIIKTGYFASCSEMPGVAHRVIEQTNADTVVLGAFWRDYASKGQAVERNGLRIEGGTPGAVDAAYANLEDDVRELIREHRKVFLVLAQAADERFDPKRMISRSLTGFRIDPQVSKGVPIPELLASSAKVNDRLRAIAARTGAGLIDPFRDVCAEARDCRAFFGHGEPKYADDKHLRPGFVRDHVTVFDDLLTR